MKKAVKRFIKGRKNSKTLHGVLDSIDNGTLKGWVSYKDGRQFENELDLYVDGEFIQSFPAVSFRADLKDAGIASGYAGFEVHAQSLSDVGVSIEIRNGSITVLSHIYTTSEPGFKNKDPYLEGFLNKLKLKSDSLWMKNGLFATVIVSAEAEKAFAGDSFIRLINDSAEKQEILFGQNLKCSVNSDDYLACSINSERNIELVYNVVKNSESLSIDRLVLARSGWHSQLTKIPLLASGGDRLEFTIVIPAKSHVDIGFIGLSNHEVNLRKTQKKLLSSLKPKNSRLLNADFSTSLGTDDDFKLLKHKAGAYKELRYEDKNGMPSSVYVKHSSTGLKVRVEQVNRFARFSYPLNIRDCQTGNYSLRLLVDQLGQNKNVFKSVYIYEVGGQGKTINKLRFERQQLSEGLTLYSAVLSEKLVNQLVSHARNVEEIRLAVELVEGEEFELKTLQFTIDEDVSSPMLLPAIGNLEDDAISGQLDVIKGFDYVSSKDEIDLEMKVLTAKTIPHETIDIVIPVYNAKEFVLQCVNSIVKNTSLPFRIIAVDDCSNDGVYEALLEVSQSDRRIEVYRNSKNVGYTGNVNKGLSIAKSDWAVLLNSDTVVTPLWLENMLEVAKNSPRCAMVGPLGNAASWQSIPNVFTTDGQWDFNTVDTEFEMMEVARLVSKFDSEMSFDVGVLNGFCQLINLKAFNEVGRLDEQNFPRGYGEENDLCARLVKSGYRLICTINAYVYHHKSKSFGHEERNELSKLGSAKLKELHPDYDWALVTRKFHSQPNMKVVRDLVKEFVGE